MEMEEEEDEGAEDMTMTGEVGEDDHAVLGTVHAAPAVTERVAAGAVVVDATGDPVPPVADQTNAAPQTNAVPHAEAGHQGHDPALLHLQ